MSRWGITLRWGVWCLWSVLFLVWWMLFLQSPGRFPIRQVDVQFSNQLVSKHRVLHAFKPYLHYGFFTFPLRSFEHQLLQLPGVSAVHLSLSWPSTLHVYVQEIPLLGRWGLHAVLTKTGQRLTLPEGHQLLIKQRPVFFAPAGQELHVSRIYAKMNAALSGVPRAVMEVQVSTWGGWTLVFEGGVTLRLGHRHVLERLERFIIVYPKIFANQRKRVNYIDMRYQNGLAVKWQS